MSKVLIGALVFLLVACSGAEQKPEKKWNVKVSKTGEPKVWVTKPDGSKQCAQSPPVLTPSSASQDLKAVGVMVFQGRTGNDGMMYPAVCGGNTGNTVDLEIAETDLAKALSQGFKTMNAPEQN